MKYLLALLLSGCTVTTITHKSIDGIPYVEVLDAKDNPCGNRRYTDGCYSERNGIKYVYFSSIAPSHTINHELAHVRGMSHTPWVYDPWKQANCARVRKAIEGYPLNATICVSKHGESITKEQP